MPAFDPDIQRTARIASSSFAGAGPPRERAIRFAANVLPIMREIRAAGVATLEGMASALNARASARLEAARGTAVRNLLAREASDAAA